MEKSMKSITDESQCEPDEKSNLSMDKRQENRESRVSGMSKLPMNKHHEDPENRSERRKLTENINVMTDSQIEEKIVIAEAQGSPELRRKLSRTVAVREDARKLKTATLDRMGKMFKLHSARPNDSAKETTLENSNNSRSDQQSRREKTNSLGRMLKLVDKTGDRRRLFNQSRTGSLRRMFRRKSIGANEENANTNSNNIGVFSRMLNQWKNRSGSEDASTELDLRSSITQENKTLSSKPSSMTKLNFSSTCTVPSVVHPPSISPVETTSDD